MNSLTTIIVEVTGEMPGGRRFTQPIKLTLDLTVHTAEQALVKHYNCHVQTFEELAAFKRWTNATWTYPHAGPMKVNQAG